MKNYLTLASGLLITVLWALPAGAQTSASLEFGQTWQNGNVARIPGDSGGKFSISDLDTGPFTSYRLYAGHKWNNRHELRALYAPLTIHVNGRLDNPVLFQGQTFAAGAETRAKFKFNSYRLTYAYHLEARGPWRWAFGFTGKIRDAEIRLQQDAVTAKKGNVGFVPLLNVQGRYALSENMSLRFDMDGLASPQGRAIDAGLFLQRRLSEGTEAFIGYRTVEGGADNDKVYNFAWIHTAVAGFVGGF